MAAILGDQETVSVGKLDPADVCTLSSDVLAERLAWIRDEILAHARRVERLESGLAWELDAAPGLAKKLDHLIALERECCGGLVFERSEASVPGRLRLEVRGVDPDAAVFRALHVQSQHERPGWTRLAKAGGFGLSSTLLVCCVLPMLAVALLGSAAAPFARLDRPWIIGVGALAATATAWRWLGRRSAGTASRSSGNACGPGC
jgi:hypothetical protein